MKGIHSGAQTIQQIPSFGGGCCAYVISNKNLRGAKKRNQCAWKCTILDKTCWQKVKVFQIVSQS